VVDFRYKLIILKMSFWFNNKRKGEHVVS